MCEREGERLTHKPAVIALSVSLAETKRRGLHTNRRPPDKSESGLRPLDVRTQKCKDLLEAEGRFEDGGRMWAVVHGF